ncbi:5411_t:CDS:2 [Dentiscutata erythropus]|uniref:5411_t:CDS:1 n=1 Tax=Dentiscutata erythropus TaxID=1348616 RepID=A0A9N9C2P3_9GLOM|nr:5411_t:CDS:2 [Dentiscutata erythropus]
MSENLESIPYLRRSVQEACSNEGSEHDCGYSQLAPNVEKIFPDAAPMEDKMCRICFAGPEEEESLGRLISPCLCKGTMRKKSSFFQCDECKYKYAFRRTTIAKFATNEFILTFVTLTLFAFCVFIGGFLAKFLLYLYPVADFGEDYIADEFRYAPLFREPMEFSKIFRIDYVHILLGFMFVGFVGFVQLLFSLMWFGPFRFGPTGGATAGRRGVDGITAVFFTIIVAVGILKAVYGMYKLVRSASRRILERVELTILEVNER